MHGINTSKYSHPFRLLHATMIFVERRKLKRSTTQTPKINDGETNGKQLFLFIESIGNGKCSSNSAH